MCVFLESARRQRSRVTVCGVTVSVYVAVYVYVYACEHVMGMCMCKRFARLDSFEAKQ